VIKHAMDATSGQGQSFSHFGSYCFRMPY